MVPTRRSPFLCALAATALLALLPAPAGDSAPSLIRTATIGGVRGPVYYSVVDARYHAVAKRIAPNQQVAELAR